MPHAKKNWPAGANSLAASPSARPAGRAGKTPRRRRRRAQEVLQFARENPEGPFQQVRGLLADLLQVSIEIAPAIEAALGEKAQHIVVSPGRRLVDYLTAHGKRLSGRVGFLPLDAAAPPPSNIDLAEEIGVVGRADRFVQAASELAPLIRRLLSSTWIVENLSHAVALSEMAAADRISLRYPVNFLAADGLLVVGQRSASAGLISRRSELRSLAGRNRPVAAKNQRPDGTGQSPGRTNRCARPNRRPGRGRASGCQRSACRTKTPHQLRQPRSVSLANNKHRWKPNSKPPQTRSGRHSLARHSPTTLDKLQGNLAQAEARMSDNIRRIDELDAARGQRKPRLSYRPSRTCPQRTTIGSSARPAQPLRTRSTRPRADHLRSQRSSGRM